MSNPTDSYIAYTRYIKTELDRALTEEEYREAMRQYINSVSADACIRKLRREV